MINNSSKHFFQKNTYFKALALLLFLMFASCSDQGCIDADDFGEYESQTLEVTANTAQDNCTYDATLELTDSSQGSGLKACLATGNPTVVDEANVQYTSSGSKGCAYFTDAKIKNLCINQCVQECIASSSSSYSDSAPRWTATSKKTSGLNSGVTIRPGSEIYITAKGTVSLGDSIDYPSVFVQADNYLPHSKKSNWDDLFFDVTNSQSLDVKFSGKWIDGGNGNKTLGAGTSTISTAGNTDSDAKIYNGAKRLVAYLISHPSGYDFDTSATTEKTGSENVPLLPDPAAWQCSYTDDSSSTNAQNQIQSSCQSNEVSGYTNNGYSDVDDPTAAVVFPVSSSQQSSILGSYGGMIRWDSDGLNEESNYNPFGSKSCSLSSGTYSCTDSSVSSPNQMIGDLSSDVTIANSTSNSYKVSFKSLANDTSCNKSLGIKVTDSTGNYTLYDYGNNDILQKITVSNSSWSSTHISLEPTQKLVITNLASDTPSCGRAIAVRFNKYQDITIKKSGFISFTILNAATGSCTIKGRIINPTGSHTDATFIKNSDNTYSSYSGYSADFYEYDNFNATSSTDSLDSLTVAPYSSWSDEIYVRKGQKIRFSPESWNGTFVTSNALTRRCGIGMAMQIKPRPALLCRGTAQEYISNTDCSPDYSSGKLTGCQAVSTSSSCVSCKSSSSSCFSAIEISGCTDGVSNYYQKTQCVNSGTLPASCPTECTTCASDMLASSLLAAKKDAGVLDQCYDLENYTGKVANIPSGDNLVSGAFTSTTSNSSGYKGAVKLANFNGEYGNFENFSVSTDGTDSSTGNTIFKLNSPLIFTKEGRLRFMVLDGNQFNSSYSDNSVHGTSYNGSNGFKLQFSGMLNFSNGQWMQVRLCKESSDSSIICRSLTDPNPSSSEISDIAGYPRIVDIDTPSTTTTDPTITSGYKFDQYGNLIRTTVPSSTNSKECTADNSGVITAIGSYFYCHTYKYFTTAALKSKSDSEQSDISSNIEKLRLSFQILDPEIANCKLSSSSSENDGIKLSNSFYDSSDEDNYGATCDSGSTPGSETDECQRQYYCGNKYSNNSGKYYVHVKVKSAASNNTSSIINQVITPIIELMDGPQRNCTTDGSSGITATNDGTKTSNSDYDGSSSSTSAVCTLSEYEAGTCVKQYYCKEASVGQAERIYKLLIADNRYKAIVTMCLVVMFTFYGLGFLMGISELNHSEIIGRIVKIGLIYLFIGETGWDWFNVIVVRFFKNGTDSLAFLMASSFDSSSELSTAIQNGDYYDKSILFTSIDKVFSLFLSEPVMKKTYALLFASLFGWAYLIIIYLSFLLYVYAVCNAVLLYLTAQVFISILFTLGPIFFIFTLFNQTKEMFDNWLKQLIGFSLQQIFLLTTLAFFNMLMYEVIKMSLGYKICWDDIWTINIITRVTLLSGWTIASLPPRTNAQSNVGNIGNPDGIPSLFSILFIWVIASLMNKFIGFMTSVAASISGGISASDLSSGVQKIASDMKNKAKAYANEKWEKTGGKMIQRADMAIFDSGKMADAAREKRKTENEKTNQLKKELFTAGNQAVSDYKKNNAAEYANMNSEQKREALLKARNEGMTEKAEKLGLSPEELKKLKADKGMKYEGTNVVGAAVSVGWNSFGSGTSFKSLDEKSVNTSFSAKEMKGALENAKSKEERAKLVEASESGKLQVEKSNSAAALEMAGNARKFVTTSKSASMALKELEKDNSNLKKAGIIVGGSLGAVAEVTGKVTGLAVGTALTPVALPVYFAGKKAVKTADDSLQYLKDRKEAVKFLEDTGKIDKMAAGNLTGWARSEDDQKLIAKEINKMKSIRKERKEDVQKPDARAISDVKRDADRLEKFDEINENSEGPIKDFLRKTYVDAERNLPGLSSQRNKAEAQAEYKIAKEFPKKLQNDLKEKNQKLEKLQKTENEYADFVNAPDEVVGEKIMEQLENDSNLQTFDSPSSQAEINQNNKVTEARKNLSSIRNEQVGNPKAKSQTLEKLVFNERKNANIGLTETKQKIGFLKGDISNIEEAIKNNPLLEEKDQITADSTDNNLLNNSADHQSESSKEN